MIDLRPFIASILIALIIVAIISTVVCRYMIRRTVKVVSFVDKQRAAYQASADYQPLSLTLAQQVYSELFAIPSHYFIFSSKDDRTKWNPCKLLLECAIAIGAQAEIPAVLVYGSYRDPKKDRNRHSVFPQASFWLEFTYDDNDWALWIDELELESDSSEGLEGTAKVHCCTTAVFRAQAAVHTVDACTVETALRTYQSCRIAESATSTESTPPSKSQIRRERMQQLCENTSTGEAWFV